MLNPIRSIRIYSHGNPCSLKTRYKEKQDKLAKRDVLRSVGRAWITIVHLLLGKGEGEGAAGKGKAGKRVGRLRRVKGKRGRRRLGREKGKGVGWLRRVKGKRGRRRLGRGRGWAAENREGGKVKGKGKGREDWKGRGEGGWRLLLERSKLI
jgi:hypothetical protein